LLGETARLLFSMPSKKDAMLTIQAVETRPTTKIHITPFTITEMAESKLRSKPYLALKNVFCDYLNGVLVLRGCLPSYYLKQVAQEVVARLDGVERIDNQIQVMTSARRLRQG
jgi:osmotically-inducible protein OsmY